MLKQEIHIMFFTSLIIASEYSIYHDRSYIYTYNVEVVYRL